MRDFIISFLLSMGIILEAIAVLIRIVAQDKRDPFVKSSLYVMQPVGLLLIGISLIIMAFAERF